MPDLKENLSSAVVELPALALKRMVKMVRFLDRLSRNDRYRQQVYAHLPEVARFDPGHDAVMMCYDFHLAGDVPRLIEVNTNAGGGLLAYLADSPPSTFAPEALPAKLKHRLLQMFAAEMQRFSAGLKVKPSQIAIMDENPPEQHLYVEMCAFADLLRSWGVATEIVDPGDLDASEDGVNDKGARVDLIYNRHCDFYLESPAMAGVRAAYLRHKVCLTPNPHVYGLVADKRRLVLWSDKQNWELWGLSEAETTLLEQVLPKASLLQQHDLEKLWAERKEKVFKPVTSFGSRGVLLGKKTTRTRFHQLPLAETLVQELVPPSMTAVPGYEPMKTDFRLYAYRHRILGVTARLYRGQVTNLRTPGGGFAAVRIRRSS